MSKTEHHTQSESDGMRAAWPALGLALASAVFLFALGLRVPAAQVPVALVFGPTVSPGTALERVAALDGRIVRVGGTDNIVIARFDKDISLRQLWGHGVWFGLDPVFMGGCLTPTSSVETGIVS